MGINQNKIFQIEYVLGMCYKVYEEYSWLLDAYVSDFYVNNHWYKLPTSWREALKNLEPEAIANIIEPRKPLQNLQVLPLSLIALRQSIKCLSIPRKQQVINTNQSQASSNSLFYGNVFAIPNFNKSFWKRVKLKKKHEIEVMSEMCYKLAVETNCYYIVDVGSGLGHLSRFLSYGYGLKVCGLEAQECLSQQASKLDEEIEGTIRKYSNQPLNKNLKPNHINIEIKTTADGDDILEAVKEAFGKENANLQFGIVGLHPCGDLGPTLLRLFMKSAQVKFINIVGCCYMKLSTSLSTSVCGYPLSNIGKQKNYDLSYCSREVACHALESYVHKLYDGQYWQLKIHAYRAALEKVIVKKWPFMYHSQVCSVKCSKELTFSEYCAKATANLDIQLAQTDLDIIQNDLEQWKNVVLFYSLRLMIAPLVETIILWDRLLFVMESGHQCREIAIFNPLLSPRNQVLTAIKQSENCSKVNC